MAENTLVFGEYFFPNKTFQLEGHPLRNRMDQDVVPRSKGVKIIGQVVDARRLRVRGQLHGSSEATVMATLNEMLDNLDSGEQRLLYRGDRYYPARLRNFIHRWERGLTEFVARVTMDFVASWPFALGIATDDDVRAISSSPTSYNVVQVGRAPTRPFYEFKATALDTDNLQLENTTTDQKMAYRGPVPAGSVVKIDAEAGTVTIDGVDALQSFDGDFIELAGLTNAMTYTGMNLDYLKTEYRDAYYA